MVEYVPGSFKNHYKYSDTGINCQNCTVEMIQNHISLCPAKEQLREGLDMSKLDDMVEYLRRYLGDVRKTESGSGS